VRRLSQSRAELPQEQAKNRDMPQFKKGHAKIGGRRRGTPNKATDLRALIMEALDRAGGIGGAVGYFVWLSHKKPTLFVRLLLRCIPRYVECPSCARGEARYSQTTVTVRSFVSPDAVPLPQPRESAEQWWSSAGREWFERASDPERSRETKPPARHRSPAADREPAAAAVVPRGLAVSQSRQKRVARRVHRANPVHQDQPGQAGHLVPRETRAPPARRDPRARKANLVRAGLMASLGHRAQMAILGMRRGFGSWGSVRQPRWAMSARWGSV
jgi:hypothetical protein